MSRVHFQPRREVFLSESGEGLGFLKRLTKSIGSIAKIAAPVLNIAAPGAGTAVGAVASVAAASGGGGGGAELPAVISAKDNPHLVEIARAKQNQGGKGTAGTGLQSRLRLAASKPIKQAVSELTAQGVDKGDALRLVNMATNVEDVRNQPRTFAAMQERNQQILNRIPEADALELVRRSQIQAGIIDPRSTAPVDVTTGQALTSLRFAREGSRTITGSKGPAVYNEAAGGSEGRVAGRPSIRWAEQSGGGSGGGGGAALAPVAPVSPGAVESFVVAATPAPPSGGDSAAFEISPMLMLGGLALLAVVVQRK